MPNRVTRETSLCSELCHLSEGKDAFITILSQTDNITASIRMWIESSLHHTHNMTQQNNTTNTLTTPNHNNNTTQQQPRQGKILLSHLLTHEANSQIHFSPDDTYGYIDSCVTMLEDNKDEHVSRTGVKEHTILKCLSHKGLRRSRSDQKAMLAFESTSFTVKFGNQTRQTDPEIGIGFITREALEKRRKLLIESRDNGKDPEVCSGMVGWFPGEIGWHLDDQSVYIESQANGDQSNKLGIRPSKEGRKINLRSGTRISTKNDRCYFHVMQETGSLVLCVFTVPESMRGKELVGCVSWNPCRHFNVVIYCC